ncbi:phosphorylase family protein [Commensalibacter papalotli (ex Servin-Garciduenas et al. 2014)]|uniref:Nucleoside phosphorylase domain-containing protein n=1 Tax=Commensalibacter papalotli (ex Servin-Garciduenas et al. 2014) TaxID=1208583 RepID=W7DS82_9PROT|nr:hypothetical protein [Commensalibacter papalotli (ex Servin-Garciduenas et al. 2014)]EUK17760.1 hypothetical protein COMX_07195 [Commensalibacter papalotli (ex Servin-Garciduenas et al. 2014)]
MQRIGVLVGMQSEAKLARHLYPAAIEASGATKEGAKSALKRLIAAKVTSIVSFGFAAGLDPLIKAGTILLPNVIHVRGKDYVSDPALRLKLGAEKSRIKVGALLHSDEIITASAEKQKLFVQTGCVALDMESGIVAQYCEDHKIPFAVLRVVCDSAARDLPPLACLALSHDGNLKISQMAKSLLVNPAQISGLIKLGVDAGLAYRQLNNFVHQKNMFESV